MAVRLVLFDAMHTLLAPATAVGDIYAAVFARHIGRLDPAAVDAAFAHAIRDVKQQQPLLRSQDTTRWWELVIKTTAVGAGANPRLVDDAMPRLYTDLMAAYNTETAYRLFDDVRPTLRRLHDMRVRTGVVTNSDTRITLQDLGIMHYLDPVLVSQEEGVEKPHSEIWLRATQRAQVSLHEALHVGDDVDRDWRGAQSAGLHALLLKRSSSDTQENEQQVPDLSAVVRWVERHNAAAAE